MVTTLEFKLNSLKNKKTELEKIIDPTNMSKAK